MLIHGAIIARKLGIPCVNGIPHAVEIVEEGAIVTVDGCLGIVTVGAPEFDLEVAQYYNLTWPEPLTRSLVRSAATGQNRYQSLSIPGSVTDVQGYFAKLRLQ